MTESRVRILCNAGAMIGESPALLGDSVRWTDPVSRHLLRFDSSGNFEEVTTPASIWSLAPLPDGTLAGALDDRFCTLTQAGEIAAGPAATIDAGCRFNDMTTDASGGLWVGMMHRGILATRGAIFYSRSVSEPPARVAAGLGVPNGMKVSADGKTLFVVDTLERTLLAYPVDRGTLGEPVIVSDFLGLPGKPDGMTLGPDGTFWVAMWGGSSVVQLARDGAYLRRIDVPAPHVSSLCFAGQSRLLVTSSRMRLSPQALLEHPGSGGLFEILLEHS
ncbi:MAG TPA: SMP-30/gluconolactonase/LRE family protein [Steroidobacter sp.]|uniref:SMP-30/gluconolactonase/LRE family protein n=1 Tax=Steroidobacter sp. TaxID=1978227 RepID=UPI002ED7FC5F